MPEGKGDLPPPVNLAQKRLEKARPGGFKVPEGKIGGTDDLIEMMRSDPGPKSVESGDSSEKPTGPTSIFKKKAQDAMMESND